MNASVTRKFYSIFWQNEACQDMFLLHREQLLEKDEIEDLEDNKKHFYTKRFVISNSNGKEDLVDKLFQRLKNRGIDSSQALTTVGQKNFDQRKVEKYINGKFGPVIKAIRDKMDGSNFEQAKFVMEATSSLLSEKRFLKFLQKYKVITTEITSAEQLSEFFENFLKTEINKLLTPQNIADLISSLDHISEHYHNMYVESLLQLNDFYSDILSDKTNFKSRKQLYDQLYEAGVLEGGKLLTYYECLSCNPGCFKANATVNAMPSKLKLSCPICGKELFYLAPYEINEEIFNQIKDKDGVLFFAIKYLIEQKETDFKFNTYLSSDVEADFVLYKGREITDIVEIKMYKLDRPDEVLRTNLESDISKVLSNRKKLLNTSESFGNVNYHLITNIRDKNIYSDARETFKSQLKQEKLSIYSPDQYRDTHFDEID